MKLRATSAEKDQPFKPVVSGSTEGIMSVAKKLPPVVTAILNEKGSLTLFALFQQREVSDKWDVVVAADWMYADTSASLHYISKKVSAALNERDITSIGGIAVLDRGHPLLHAVLSAFRVEGGLATILNSSINGIVITSAVLLYAKRNDA